MSGNTFEVINSILDYLKNNKNFKLLTNQIVTNIEYNNSKITELKTNNNKLKIDKLLVTTGAYTDMLNKTLKLTCRLNHLKAIVLIAKN